MLIDTLEFAEYTTAATSVNSKFNRTNEGQKNRKPNKKELAAMINQSFITMLSLYGLDDTQANREVIFTALTGGWQGYNQNTLTQFHYNGLYNFNIRLKEKIMEKELGINFKK